MIRQKEQVQPAEPSLAPTSTQDGAGNSGKGQERRGAVLSKDGKWRSFPRVPHLLQYVSSGVYYARVKVSGKLIRKSLKTTVWTTAKLRLADFLKENREAPEKGEIPTFQAALSAYREKVAKDSSLKPRSREYRGWCISKILKSWPELTEKRLDEISERDCLDWGDRLSKEIASQYFNNTVDTLRRILDAGIALMPFGPDRLANPAEAVKKVKVRQKRLELPSRAEFKALVENIRNQSGGWAKKSGDLVEFLAYTGLRLNTEACQVRWEDVLWEEKQIQVNGDPETGTKNWERRRIPMIADLENLLLRMKEDRGGEPSGKILKVSRCYKTLTRACREIGIARISHHDLRHLFATRCIESGVDIPTVSRWMGHKDGGALAMKVYGHLRNEHSREMASKVHF